jgi:hypothetical protein
MYWVLPESNTNGRVPIIEDYKWKLVAAANKGSKENFVLFRSFPSSLKRRYVPRSSAQGA